MVKKNITVPDVYDEDDEDKFNLDHLSCYTAALYALVNRCGGHVVLQAIEMPDRPFNLVHRSTEEGGLEFKISRLQDS